MPLSKLIVSFYAIFLEISMWILLLGATFTGWQQKGIPGAIMGFLGAFVLCTVFFGAFLILAEIQKLLKEIQKNQSK